jgi:hypothetical protein
VSTVFAAFLGYNPIRHLLGPTGALSQIPASSARVLTSKRYFPHLIGSAFHHGLVVVFAAGAAISAIAAVVSLMRGAPEPTTGELPQHGDGQTGESPDASTELSASIAPWSDRPGADGAARVPQRGGQSLS